MKAFRAVVHGRVQMVMYRDYAQRKARRLGVVGEVKNLVDGTVEIFAEAEESILDDYIARLKKGSILSHVTQIDVTWHAPTFKFKDFSIIH